MARMSNALSVFVSSLTHYVSSKSYAAATTAASACRDPFPQSFREADLMQWRNGLLLPDIAPR